ncbi:MAG: alpha/beta fold hydrolase, partial [Dehalococcoidia bacterium]|nr:alpha/beta fold hydrolase [Dehalococcoidia bacterium]
MVERSGTVTRPLAHHLHRVVATCTDVRAGFDYSNLSSGLWRSRRARKELLDKVTKGIDRDLLEVGRGGHGGNGNGVVLVHGAIGDGEFAWDELLPHLADRFTCYLPSTRGRGLSADHPDHSLPRLQEDVIAFVESIGEPVSLMGWSGGGPFVLGAAARSDAVAAVAVWESGASADALGPDGQACLGQLAAAIEQVGVAASDGRLIDAVHAFLAGICNDDEVAALDGTDFHERWSGSVPQLLSFYQQLMASEGPGPDHPEALAQVTVPVLLLTGE